MATDKEIINQMNDRVNHLTAVLEPAKRLDKEIIKLSSLLGIRFRKYLKSIMDVHNFLDQAFKDVKKRKTFLMPKHYIKCMYDIKDARKILEEILDTIRKIYVAEDKDFNIETILKNDLDDIKENIEAFDKIHPLGDTYLKNIDGYITNCRKNIAEIQVELKVVYKNIKEMYDIFRKEESLMTSFYSKIEHELDRLRNMQTQGYKASGFARFNRHALLYQDLYKEFKNLVKQYDARFDELFKVKNERIAVIKDIVNASDNRFKKHKHILSMLEDIKSALERVPTTV